MTTKQVTAERLLLTRPDPELTPVNVSRLLLAIDLNKTDRHMDEIENSITALRESLQNLMTLAVTQAASEHGTDAAEDMAPLFLDRVITLAFMAGWELSRLQDQGRMLPESFDLVVPESAAPEQPESPDDPIDNAPEVPDESRSRAIMAIIENYLEPRLNLESFQKGQN